MVEESHFELSRSSQLNEVIQLGRQVIEGAGDSSEFKKSVKKLNYLRRDMRRLLRQELKFQENSSVITNEASKIEANLKKLKAGIEETYRYFKTKKHTHILKGIAISRESFEALFTSFDILKEDAQKRTSYSESPFQDELMRVGYGVINGTIKPEAFRERLDGMRRFVKNYYDQFESLEPGESERYYFEEHKASIKKVIKAYLKGLDEANKYFKDKSHDHIKKGLTLSGKASGKLIEYQKALMKASEGPKTKLCFKCGAENSISSRCCIMCNAAFPTFGPVGESTVEIRMDREGVVRDTNHVRTEYTEKLVEAVKKVKNGSLTPEKFKSILEELEQKTLKAKQEKGSLKVPDDVQGGEGADFFDGVEQMMSMGLEEILDGIEQMKRYAASGHEGHLTFGLETALGGADKLFQVQLMSKEMKESS